MEFALPQNRSTLATLLVAALCCANSPAGAVSARLAASAVENGGVSLIEINTSGVESPDTNLTAWLDDQLIQLFSYPQHPNTYFGIIGINYESPLGVRNIHLTWMAGGKFHQQYLPLKIVQGSYRTERLRVAPRVVSPSSGDKRRIQGEMGELAQIYGSITQKRFWQGDFPSPVKSTKVTSPYGSRRLFNDTLHGYHAGLDLRAPTGTKIFAANRGIVKAAKDFFYGGNTVIIDHGLGLYTSYCHLSKSVVGFADFVEKGQLLGFAGATGRANGPHLHWGTKVLNAQVNPLRLQTIVLQLEKRLLDLSR